MSKSLVCHLLEIYSSWSGLIKYEVEKGHCSNIGKSGDGIWGVATESRRPIKRNKCTMWDRNYSDRNHAMVLGKGDEQMEYRGP